MQTELLFPQEIEPEPERALLTSLLQQSRLYTQSKSYRDLLDFVSRLPHFAPFNAMLLNIQKPGLRFAAFESDWRDHFRRTVKDGARPLVILWPFAPVAFVYDMEDTDGEPLPADVAQAFRANGAMDGVAISTFEERLLKFGIYLKFIEYGDGRAGSVSPAGVEVEGQSADAKKRRAYRIRINARHNSNVQFATLTHELAHLFLGHLGGDLYLRIPDRSFLDQGSRETEAESVSFLVCHRARVQSDADRYLAHFLSANVTVEKIDVYALMRVAGQIENALGIALRSRPY